MLTWVSALCIGLGRHTPDQIQEVTRPPVSFASPNSAYVLKASTIESPYTGSRIELYRDGVRQWAKLMPCSVQQAGVDDAGNAVLCGYADETVLYFLDPSGHTRHQFVQPSFQTGIADMGPSPSVTGFGIDTAYKRVLMELSFENTVGVSDKSVWREFDLISGKCLRVKTVPPDRSCAGADLLCIQECRCYARVYQSGDKIVVQVLGQDGESKCQRVLSLQELTYGGSTIRVRSGGRKVEKHPHTIKIELGDTPPPELVATGPFSFELRLPVSHSTCRFVLIQSKSDGYWLRRVNKDNPDILEMAY